MDLTLWQLVLLSGIGGVAGWLNVMAGGGSMLTIPVMVFMDLPGPVANGTNRIAILAQNISASITFFREGFRELKLGLSLSAAALPGAMAGALVGVNLEGVWFDRVLALIMLGIMLVMMISKKQPADSSQPAYSPTRKQLVVGHLCMLGAGFWGGFIQVGVGFILMPILNRVMGLDLVRVNALKVFIVLCYTLVALVIFASNTEIVWVAGLALALGNAIGGWLGARSSINSGETLIRWVLNSVLIVFIAKLLLF